ncbi:MAG: endonuclease Q family protein [bacterium]
MRYIFDSHIHSKYSRACSPQLVLPEIDKWAKIKGINIVGTGDFTHPLWFKDLKEKLVEAEEGLYKLRDSQSGVLFLAQTEISCIYSQGGQTRRLHLVIFAPNLEVVQKINQELARVGAKLNSDGRPIIGMSAKKLTELIFNVDKNCLVVPAHAFTPWFAVFGSKSGFDSLAECFEELTPFIYAIETGLSSDPKMNWRLSALDKITLLSGSDAHSAPHLGREANVFEMAEPSYSEIARIIREKDKAKFLFTIEFFPEEGIYHFDGHRACNVRLSPGETKKIKNICPQCKKPLTIGTMHRVDNLADRPEGFRPPEAIDYKSLVPLPEIIAEAKGVKSKSSKAVGAEYENLIRKGKSEFNILLNLSDEEIKTIAEPMVAEGIIRVRNGRLKIEPGYDGLYGKVVIFPEKQAILTRSQPAKLF